MIIGLGSQAQVGKDTAAGFLVQNHGFTRLAFADILKKVLYDMDPIVANNRIPVHLQDVVDENGWEAAKEMYEVRRLLQNLGVAARYHIGERTWVQPIFDRIMDMPDRSYVITDVRFPNEFSMLKSMELLRNSCTMVKITREAAGDIRVHESETSLDDAQWDVVLPNDGTISQLETRFRMEVLLG